MEVGLLYFTVYQCDFAAKGCRQAVANAAFHLWSTTAEAIDYPRLDGDRQADVVVVGAGYAGLNCALQLARQHQRSVIVVDAHWPGWGASGRNGGFCCIGGGKLSPQAIVKRWGEPAARAFALTQRQAIEHVQQLLQQGIDAEPTGQGELCLAHTRRAAQQFESEAQQIRQLHGVQAQLWSAAQAREHGATMQGAHGGLYSPLGFGLNPWKYVTGLAAKCKAAGVELYSQSPVTQLHSEAGGWQLQTSSGTVRAKKLVIATNGYSSDNLPAWMAARYLPALSSVLVTRAMSSDTEYQAQGFSKAHQDFQRLFPAWADVEQEYFWSGLVCFTASLQPFVGAVPELNYAYAAFGWHGNGVAMASYSGKTLADVVAGADSAQSICAPMRSVPTTMPLGRYRRALLRLAYAAAAVTDRW